MTRQEGTVAESRTYHLFYGVVVPAVMGNTVWALVQVLVSRSWDFSILPRVTSLALLCLFFLGDWVDDRPHATRRYLEGGPARWFVYFTLTTLFYVLCASLAIQIADPFWYWLPSSALLLFIVTAGGQTAGVWADREEHGPDKTRRLCSAWTNAVAAIALGALWWLLRLGPVGRGDALQSDAFHWVIAGTLFVAILPHVHTLVRQLRYADQQQHAAGSAARRR
jgi:hypothetical protein